MILVAHHAGEQLILAATVGSGLLSASVLVLRARLEQAVRRRRRT